ncbi:hypothetical protein [Streptomyces sp. NPDC001774]
MAEEFFGADHALQSTVLYVDDEIEHEIAERHGIGIALAQAVADELHWESSDKALLWRVLSQCHVWTADGQIGAPPSLPVLAVSVLAASRMASSDGMRRTNFRGRWYQVLGEAQTGPRANRLDKSLDDVAAMWEQLDAWMEETGGLYGASTVSTDEYYWRVGYPISQALVRRADREALTRFFATTRLRRGNSTGIPGRELLRRLAAWTAGRDRRLSPRFMEELELAAAGRGSFEKGDPLIVTLLERLAKDWDGKLHEPERERRRHAVGLRIAVTDRGRSLEWIADAADDVTEATVQIHDGRSFDLRADYGGVYSGLESLHPSEPQLRMGVRLEGDDLVVEWVPQDVVLLRVHPDLGEWVSTEYFEPGEQHWVLAASSAAAQVRTMLGALGSRTVREAAAPVPGWRIFKGVRAVDSSAFTRALDSGGEHTHILHPQIRQHAKLVGGLRIAREYQAGSGVAGHYLRGGEPDLLLPDCGSPDSRVEVVLDGLAENLRADPRVPFPLNCLSFDEGQHTVGTEASSQVFTVHDGFHEGLPEDTGSLGYAVHGSAAPLVSRVGSTEKAIRGAQAPASVAVPKTTMVKSPVIEAFFLDASGGVTAVRPQTVPPWIARRLPDAAVVALEAVIPEGAVWLVYRTPQRWWVRALVSESELPEPTPGPDDYRWAYAVLSAGDRCGATGWSDYVAAAEHIVGTANRETA